MPIAIDGKVSHSDLDQFGRGRVNLGRDLVLAYRQQTANLRDRLERHIDLHPDFDLVKIRESGSLPKGTALRSTSDVDLAVYVARARAPEKTPDLVGWMLDRLRQAYSFLDPSQFSTTDVTVTIDYRGSGINVEMLPVLYDGDPDDYGEIILRRSGARVRTSIPKHIEFIRKRKARFPASFTQFVRFLKYWRNVQVRSKPLALNSFVLELLCSWVVDTGVNPSDYPSALEAFFARLVRTGLRDRVAFADNYPAVALPRPRLGVVEIFDPVNATNNVASDLTEADRLTIVEAAHDALDDIALARTASSREAAIGYWRALFGPEFTI